MTALKLLGMHNGQPVFEQLPYDARNNNVFSAAGGELMYQTDHGCLALPYIPLHITPVSWTPCMGVQQTQPQQEPPREMVDTFPEMEIAQDPFSQDQENQEASFEPPS